MRDKPGQRTGRPPRIRILGERRPRIDAALAGLLKSFGWKYILDQGDITTARGVEMYLPLWLRLWGSLQNPMFSVKVIR